MARILIVDDALIMRKMIRTIVEKAGHIVVGEAVNGEEGIKKYKEYNPDLVTMDITMPEVDGIEALTRIVDYDVNAKVVMVSALGQQHKVFDALKSGAKGYILKPIKGEKILSVINDLVESSSCPISLSKSVFECGEERNQQDCDRILSKQGTRIDEPVSFSLPFVVENKEGTFWITIMREFKCDDFTELMKAVQGMLFAKPLNVIFNFTRCNVLNSRVFESFMDIMVSIIRVGGALRIICYNQDYVSFFRNDPIFKKVGFELVKKEEGWRKTL